MHQLWLLQRARQRQRRARQLRYYLTRRAATGCPIRMAQTGAGQVLPDLKSKVKIVIWSCYC
jgi:hypothetical protein